MILFPPLPVLLAALAGALVSACAIAPEPPAAAIPQIGPHLALDVSGADGHRIGSAVALDNGLVLTAAHVLGARPERIRVTDSRGRQAEARLIARSTRMDLAVLATMAPAGEAAILRADRPDATERVSAHGVTAAGIGRADGAVLEPVSSLAGYGSGLVARLGAVQGYSGGPMLDAQGRLVGITVALRAGRMDLALAAAQPPAHRTQGSAGSEVFALGVAEIRAELAALGIVF